MSGTKAAAIHTVVNAKTSALDSTRRFPVVST